jgi:predicted SAM-dependent methyltransferase
MRVWRFGDRILARKFAPGLSWLLLFWREGALGALADPKYELQVRDGGTLVREALKRVPFLRPTVRFLRKQHQRRECKKAWAAYASTESVLKLDIGSSVHVLPGWFNVDIQPFRNGQYFLDATERFPFSDCSFDFIRSEHMIEHISHLDGLGMLQECHRVLKPGGFIRIATPDLKKLAKLYDAAPSDEQQEYVDAVFKHWRKDYDGAEVGVAINQIFMFGHRFIYDSGTLGEWLGKAGFMDIVQVRPGFSAHATYLGTDAHASDQDYITFETLTMEARKPSAA